MREKSILTVAVAMWLSEISVTYNCIIEVNTLIFRVKGDDRYDTNKTEDDSDSCSLGLQ